MRLNMHPVRGPQRPGPTVGDRRRPQFAFVGALDEVPPEAAATLAEVTSALLRHADGHAGAREQVRVIREPDAVSLWIEDPECCTACLEQTGHLDAISTPRTFDAGTVRVEVRDDHGLRLHWRLAATN